jgi:transcriptional regulator with XRE-family HTH domain
MSFGKKLKRARKAKGISAYRLAQLSGVAANHIGAIEAGRIKSPSLDVVIRLADALAVPIGELVPGAAGVAANAS